MVCLTWYCVQQFSSSFYLILFSSITNDFMKGNVTQTCTLSPCEIEWKQIYGSKPGKLMYVFMSSKFGKECFACCSRSLLITKIVRNTFVKIWLSRCWNRTIFKVEVSYSASFFSLTFVKVLVLSQMNGLRHQTMEIRKHYCLSVLIYFDRLLTYNIHFVRT